MIITKDSRIDLRINGNLKENIRQVAYNNGYTLSNYLNKMIENYPYFTKLTLPKDFHPALSNNSDIETLSIKTALITSADTPNHIVYSLTKEIFENLNILKNKSEVTLNLEVEELFKGLTIPLHPGALMYFKEKGLIHKIDQKLLPKGRKLNKTTISKI